MVGQYIIGVKWTKNIFCLEALDIHNFKNNLKKIH